MARIVVKIGTSVLTGGGLSLDTAHMAELAGQCARLMADGHQVLLCSSGAIAAGRARTGLAPSGLPSRQMLAAVGQTHLMQAWQTCFVPFDVVVGQLLFTRADVEDRRRYLNARDALEAMLGHGVLPIANENDAVATAEIRLGDNDALSALLAGLCGADLLILLTDQPGLFTADPRSNPEARLITDVSRVDDRLRATAGGAASDVGTGGMATKVLAAEIAGRAGAAVVVASGHAPDVIIRATAGEPVGTRFAPTNTPLEHRKRWILAGPAARASIVVDAGAANAVLSNGRSLLPAGILHVDGAFSRGDTVRVRAEGGRELGRGIVQYDHAELMQLVGRRSTEIEQILGYSRGPVAIHRNDFVVQE
ncbi:MAG: glutamate 5-kinase [Rhodothermales bacterium]|nr:glutamate 5-kinase [Rhodothermales bacterium]MBO6778705.1 glutamate 5-kinase [Rhodothermales bacterium]